MWYLCLRKRKAVQPAGPRKVDLDVHLEWMRRQHEAGKVLFSGPSPKRGLGIYVIRADSEAEAAEIAAADPYTGDGQTEFELIEWDVRQVLGAGPFTAAAIQAQTRRPPPKV
ncbi:MAG TPA: YciI family protein [Burkholderiales bacterium]|jgi:uncharacterized protein YciI|nr:YciI family protein [Burkholderiales bacterium]